VADIKGVFAGLNTRLRRFKGFWREEFHERVEQKTPVLSGEMQRSWYSEEKRTDIEIGNFAEHASHVEYGTIHMAPRAPLRRTLMEANEISRIAIERAK
jgi:hypothetical protein